MSAELEEARALGQLVKQGWRPQRTIVYAAWDGEEQGLLGSTEWVEHHEPELRDKAVVYINTDGNGRGFLNAGGSHTLETLVNAVAKEVEDPETKASVWKRMQARAIVTGAGAATRKEARTRPDLRISALGSGSDYSAFLQHAGVAHAESRVQRAGSERRHLSLDLRRLLPLHEVPRHRTSRTAVRSRRRWAASSSGLPTPTCCPSSSRAWPIPCRPTSPSSRRSSGRSRPQIKAN